MQSGNFSDDDDDKRTIVIIIIIIRLNRFSGLEKTKLRDILKQRMSTDQKPSVPVPEPDPALLPMAHMDYAAAASHPQYDPKDMDESQFKPLSHYAQPYYRSNAGDNGAQQQQYQSQQHRQNHQYPQQQSSTSRNGQQYSNNSISRSSFSRTSLTTADATKTPKSSSVEYHMRNNYGADYKVIDSDERQQPPPLPPNRTTTSGPSTSGQQNSTAGQEAATSAGSAGSGANGAEAATKEVPYKRLYSMNGMGLANNDPDTGSGGRQSLSDRPSRQSPGTSGAAYSRSAEDRDRDGGAQRRDSRDSQAYSRFGYRDFVEVENEHARLKRNAKYVNRDQQSDQSVGAPNELSYRTRNRYYVITRLTSRLNMCSSVCRVTPVTFLIITLFQNWKIRLLFSKCAPAHARVRSFPES